MRRVLLTAEGCFWAPQLSIALFGDHHLTRHVRVKLAVIVDRSVGFQSNALGGIGRDHDIPGAIARRRRMRNEVGVHPFDRVADMGSDLRRCEGEVFDSNLKGLGARRSHHGDEKEHAPSAWLAIPLCIVRAFT